MERKIINSAVQCSAGRVLRDALRLPFERATLVCEWDAHESVILAALNNDAAMSANYNPSQLTIDQ